MFTDRYVISFCVGMQLATSGITPLIQTFYIAVLSLVTPLGKAKHFISKHSRLVLSRSSWVPGIGIGIWIMSVSDGDVGDSLVSAVFQGLACGTILYVTFFEILERERSKNVSGLVQLLFIVVGYATIFMVQIVAPEPEE